MLDEVQAMESDDSGLTLRPDTISTASSNLSVQTLSSPVWTNYFAEQRSVKSIDGTLVFNVYFTAPKSSSAALYVMHHGAGSSGLSFALLCEALLQMNPQVGFLVFDARGHGESTQLKEDRVDFSLSTLCQDFRHVIGTILNETRLSSDLILVGHSLGGAVVAHCSDLDRVIGLIILDVVEGPDAEAFLRMKKYFHKRPQSFSSVEEGIDWHISTHTLLNIESARVSVPSLLNQDTSSGRFDWKTDIRSTQEFWQSWFKGFSARFLAAKAGKLLVLADTNRLDKELMIGQMRGSYQLMVIPESGHFIHEDCPERVAKAIHEFSQRYQHSNDIVKLARQRFMNKD